VGATHGRARPCAHDGRSRHGTCTARGHPAPSGAFAASNLKAWPM